MSDEIKFVNGTGHSVFGGSSASTWARCGKSITEYAIKVEKSTSSPDADYGSCAHLIAEICLTQGGRCADYAPTTHYNGVYLNKEDYHYVDEYIDRCLESSRDRYEVEVQVSFEPWVKDGYGTIDFFTMDGTHAVLRDLKFGVGNKVDAFENYQLLLYAIGIFEEFSFIYEITDFVLEIDQPRLDHVSSYTVSVDELIKWADFFSERAEIARDPSAPYVPGDKQCQWCPGNGDCSALYELTTKVVAAEDFDDEMYIAGLGKLTDEQIDVILKNDGLIRKFLDGVKKNALNRILNGGEVDGWKLVAGRSLRKWADEDQVIEILKASKVKQDIMFKKTLFSPKQAEDNLSDRMFKKIANLVVKPDGKPTLVPSTDKRESYVTGANDFDTME